LTTQQFKDIEDKLRSWLIEEDYVVKAQSNPLANFTLVATNPAAGINVTVSQSVKHSDRIETASQIVFEDYAKMLAGLPAPEKEGFLWDLRFSLVLCDVMFGMAPPDNPRSILVLRNVWHDGLTKDHFMSTLHRVAECALLVSWKLVPKFGYLKSKS